MEHPKFYFKQADGTIGENRISAARDPKASKVLMEPLVTKVLGENGLAHFEQYLAAAGHCSMGQIKVLSDAQLEAVGFKKAHLLKLKRALKSEPPAVVKTAAAALRQPKKSLLEEHTLLVGVCMYILFVYLAYAYGIGQLGQAEDFEILEGGRVADAGPAKRAELAAELARVAAVKAAAAATAMPKRCGVMLKFFKKC
jgi:hypothetical protein